MVQSCDFHAPQRQWWKSIALKYFSNEPKCLLLTLVSLCTHTSWYEACSVSQLQNVLFCITCTYSRYWLDCIQYYSCLVTCSFGVWRVEGGVSITAGGVGCSGELCDVVEDHVCVYACVLTCTCLFKCVLMCMYCASTCTLMSDQCAHMKL